jgi:hypothetical protein
MREPQYFRYEWLRESDAAGVVRAEADLDGDGAADLLWRHRTTGELYVWRMSGFTVGSAGHLDPAQLADARWRLAQVADFDGDGDPDLLWHHQETGDLYVWFLDGMRTVGGSFLTPRSFPGASWSLAPR